MSILVGIHGGHNSAVALIDTKTSTIVGNIEIERITRVKNDSVMNEGLISRVLRLYGFADSDVEGIAYGYSCNPFRENPSAYDFSIKVVQQQLFGRSVKAFLIPHHLSHVLSCALTSPRQSTLVISADGWGDNLNTCLFVVNKEEKPTQVRAIFAGYNHRSPAHMWESISIYNYKHQALQGPGKLMALAAYGKEDLDLRRRLQTYSLLPTIKKGDLEPFFLGSDFSNSRSLVSQDFAYELQRYTNDYLHGLLEFSISLAAANKIKFDDIGFAGGLGLNIVATSFAARENRLQNIVIPPFPNDSGLALGNCIAAACEGYDCSQSKLSASFTPYLGPLYEESSILNFLDSNQALFEYKILSDSEYTVSVAQDLFERLVVFRFWQRSESGPRALGNRSILYDPSDPCGRDMLNGLKKREWYRPFAPIILSSYANEILENPIYPSSYMTTSANISSSWRNKLQACTHVDNSCRPQLLKQSDNSILYSIIENFNQLKGLPAVLNTSFNIGGPIVESPEDAISVFTGASTDRKVLYVNKIRISIKTGIA